MKNLIGKNPQHPTKRWRKRDPGRITAIIVHCSGGGSRYTADGIALDHIARGWPTAAYHELIMEDGEVQILNPVDAWTYHTGAGNKRWYSVCLRHTGNAVSWPTADQLAALINRLIALAFDMELPPKKILGHREVLWIWRLAGKKVKMKDCPGVNVDMDWIREWVTRGMQRALGVKVDGIWGPISQKALENA